MLDDNELLFDELYEKTKDCGRVQFVRLLMEKERENRELKMQLEKNMKDRNTYDELIYACGKGLQKEWSRENLIIDTLYNTNEDICIYLKINDIEKLGKCDKEIDDYLIYKFGYQYIIPKSEIDLYVSKKDNRLFIKKEGLGYEYDAVEKEVYKFIKKQINTNLNCEEFLIK